MRPASQPHVLLSVRRPAAFVSPRGPGSRALFSGCAIGSALGTRCGGPHHQGVSTAIPAHHLKRLEDIVDALNRTCKLKLGASDIETIYRYQPAIARSRVDTVTAAVSGLANLFRFPPAKLQRFILTNLHTMRRTPQALFDNHLAMAKWMGVTPKRHRDFLLLYRRLVSVTPKRAEEWVVHVERELALDRETLKKMIRRSPSLFTLNPATISDNVREAAVDLCVPLDQYTAMLPRMPGLACHPSASIKERCDRFASAFGIPFPLAARTMMKIPPLLAMRPDTLDDNVRSLAKLLNLDEASVRAMALRKPGILVYKPVSLLQNVQDIAKRFSADAASVIETARTYPAILTNSPATMHAKMPLVLAICHELGFDYSAACTLRHCPLAYTYASERLEQRLAMAQHGLGPRSIMNLLSLAQPKAEVHLKAITKIKQKAMLAAFNTPEEN